MRACSIFAILEQAGYRREEIGGMTRWYAVRVVQHATDDKGALLPRYYDDGPRETWAGAIRRRFSRMALPPHIIEQEVAAFVARQKAAREARRANKGRPRRKRKG